MRSPWAFKIDYDRSIAEDEREIAALSNPVAIAVSADLTPEEQEACFGGGFQWDLAHFVLRVWGDREHADRRLAMLGLSRQDLADYVYDTVSDMEDFAPLMEGYDVHAMWERGAHARGREIAKRFEGLHWYIMPPEKRADCVKKAKASLARHRRNQAKYGK